MKYRIAKNSDGYGTDYTIEKRILGLFWFKVCRDSGSELWLHTLGEAEKELDKLSTPKTKEIMKQQ